MRIEPLPLTLAPITRSPGFFSTGSDSPVMSDSSVTRAAFKDETVDGNLFAGTDAEQLADGDLIERKVVLAAIGFDDARHLGREIEQGADGAGGLATGAKLHDLTGQDENDDGGGGLEIDGRLTVHAAQGVRKERWPEGCERAVEVADADTHADQGEHIGAAEFDGRDGALKERKCSPENDRRGEQELYPGVLVRVERVLHGRGHVKHGEHQQG